ncbi:MAG TPA: BamA/TamA family outer membrane protein [Candidatus Eisenbacteria bacterium]|nr:BamA/TamA family outer membrane protein [Candidatus Eisenbacteria bacterium]
MSRAGSALAVVLVALLAAPLVLPAPARAQLGDLDEERTVSKVVIHGNIAYKTGTLKKFLRTRGRGGFPFYRKRPLRSDYVRFDRLALQDYYRRHGFLEARVDSVPLHFNEKETEAEVHFWLTEGPRATVESVRFEGVGPVPEDKLRDALQLKAGEPLDIPKQDLSREAVEGEYAERGYIAATVRDSLEVEGTKVGIIYRIAPGPKTTLDSLLVEGTAKTKPRFVTREVTIHPGDTFARSKLLRSQQRIYDSGFYSDVRFDRGEIDSVTNSADLIVDVRERKMGWIDLGIGYGTVDQLRLTSQVGQRNVMRDGIRLVASGLLGIRAKRGTNLIRQFPYVEVHPSALQLGDSRIDLVLSRPWNFGVRVGVSVGAFAEHIRPTSGNFLFGPYEAYGGSGALSYDFSQNWHSRLSYEHRNVLSDTTNVYSVSGESYSINRVIGSLELDKRDNPFEPRRGYDLLGSSSFVGGALSGGAQFVKHLASGIVLRPVDRKSVLAFRLRGGLTNPKATEAGVPGTTPINLIPAEERFYTGGANTVRGYGESELGTRLLTDSTGVPVRPNSVIRVGGRVLLLANAELRRRLFGPFGAEAFLDAGNVWERPTDVRLSNILSFSDGAGYNDMRYSAGIGLRIATPIGPFRLDYGWKIRMARPDQADPVSSRGNFHFSVGQAF